MSIIWWLDCFYTATVLYRPWWECVWCRCIYRDCHSGSQNAVLLDFLIIFLVISRNTAFQVWRLYTFHNTLFSWDLLNLQVSSNGWINDHFFLGQYLIYLFVLNTAHPLSAVCTRRNHQEPFLKVFLFPIQQISNYK